jgi:hypothetical protein
MSVIRLKSQAFDAKTASAMAAALDRACGALGVPARARAAREVLAMHLLDLSRWHDTDIDDLCDQLLVDVRNGGRSGC